MIDYMILEALAAKDAHEQQEEHKRREVDEWKKDKSLEERIATAQ